MSPRTARLEDITSQRDALEKLAELIRKGSIDQEILRAAKAVTRDCSARDDLCELEAIFNAVKYGDSRVSWLKKGMRYVADPYPFDTFHSASAMIESCRAGACAGDCDDATVLVGSLAASIGFMVGARAWGKGTSGDLLHVYPVAAVPKSGPFPKDYFGHGLDITVPSSEVGWEPQGGHFITAWVNG
jgi:hypothetical protein